MGGGVEGGMHMAFHHYKTLKRGVFETSGRFQGGGRERNSNEIHFLSHFQRERERERERERGEVVLWGMSPGLKFIRPDQH